MYIIDVIPLALIPRNQSQILSYFHNEPLLRGAVVRVDFNYRKIMGVVVGCDTLKNRKLDFKKNVDFELKNISKVISAEPLVSELQLKTARWLSSYYFSPLGICLKTVLPPFFLKRGYVIPSFPISSDRSKPYLLYHHDRDIITDLNSIKKLISEQVAIGNQAFLMVAENTSGSYFIDKYSDLNPVYVSSELKNREYYEIWKKVYSGESKLIIGTRVGLFLPFHRLSLLVVDDEPNEAYKSDMSPRYHAADLAIYVAGIYGAEYKYSALLPRLETYYSHTNPASTYYRGLTSIVNMVGEIRAGNFSIFSRELKDALLDGKKLIIYVPRRGYANFITCQKCGSALTCPNCSASLVLHQSVSSPMSVKSTLIDLICHHCDYQQQRPKNCPACGSYGLKAIGIGIEKVIAELKKFYKYANIACPDIYRLDGDTVSDDVEERKIIDRFQRSAQSILVATQMLFSWKYLIKAPIIGIISGDALINIPDFRSEETLFRHLLTLGRMSNKLIIQTNNPEDFAIKSISSGNIRSFFEEEVKNRKLLGYPPFSRLIKMSYRHLDPYKAKKECHILAQKLRTQMTRLGIDDSDIEIMGPSPAFISREKGKYNWIILLKIMGLDIKTRNELLRVVPSGWIVDIDPIKTI